jgi:hypothetical protein
VDFFPLEILDSLGFNRFGIGEFTDSDRNGLKFGHARRSQTSTPGNNFVEVFLKGAHEQRLQHALSSEAGGQLFQAACVETPSRVGCGLLQLGYRQVPVFARNGERFSGHEIAPCVGSEWNTRPRLRPRADKALKNRQEQAREEGYNAGLVVAIGHLLFLTRGVHWSTRWKCGSCSPIFHISAYPKKEKENLPKKERDELAKRANEIFSKYRSKS